MPVNLLVLTEQSLAATVSDNECLARGFRCHERISTKGEMLNSAHYNTLLSLNDSLASLLHLSVDDIYAVRYALQDVAISISDPSETSDFPDFHDIADTSDTAHASSVLNASASMSAAQSFDLAAQQLNLEPEAAADITFAQSLRFYTMDAQAPLNVELLRANFAAVLFFFTTPLSRRSLIAPELLALLEALTCDSAPDQHDRLPLLVFNLRFAAHDFATYLQILAANTATATAATAAAATTSDNTAAAAAASATANTANSSAMTTTIRAALTSTDDAAFWGERNRIVHQVLKLCGVAHSVGVGSRESFALLRQHSALLWGCTGAPFPQLYFMPQALLSCQYTERVQSFLRTMRLLPQLTSFTGEQGATTAPDSAAWEREALLKQALRAPFPVFNQPQPQAKVDGLGRSFILPVWQQRRLVSLALPATAIATTVNPSCTSNNSRMAAATSVARATSAANAASAVSTTSAVGTASPVSDAPLTIALASRYLRYHPLFGLSPVAVCVLSAIYKAFPRAQVVLFFTDNWYSWVDTISDSEALLEQNAAQRMASAELNCLPHHTRGYVNLSDALVQQINKQWSRQHVILQWLTQAEPCLVHALGLTLPASAQARASASYAAVTSAAATASSAPKLSLSDLAAALTAGSTTKATPLRTYGQHFVDELQALEKTAHSASVLAQESVTASKDRALPEHNVDVAVADTNGTDVSDANACNANADADADADADDDLDLDLDLDLDVDLDLDADLLLGGGHQGWQNKVHNLVQSCYVHFDFAQDPPVHLDLVLSDQENFLLAASQLGIACLALQDDLKDAMWQEISLAYFKAVQAWDFGGELPAALAERMEFWYEHMRQHNPTLLHADAYINNQPKSQASVANATNAVSNASAATSANATTSAATISASAATAKTTVTANANANSATLAPSGTAGDAGADRAAEDAGAAGAVAAEVSDDLSGFFVSVPLSSLVQQRDLRPALAVQVLWWTNERIQNHLQALYNFNLYPRQLLRQAFTADMGVNASLRAKVSDAFPRDYFTSDAFLSDTHSETHSDAHAASPVAPATPATGLNTRVQLSTYTYARRYDLQWLFLRFFAALAAPAALGETGASVSLGSVVAAQLQELHRLERVKQTSVQQGPNVPAMLSFGCARGDELGDLCHYFPNYWGVGVDINPHALARARERFAFFAAQGYVALERLHFVLSADLPHLLSSWQGPQSFALVTAMTVLCRHPETIGVANAHALYPFATFKQQIEELCSYVAPHGLLCVHNANYCVEDSACSVLKDLAPLFPFPAGVELRVIPESVAQAVKVTVAGHDYALSLDMAAQDYWRYFVALVSQSYTLMRMSLAAADAADTAGTTEAAGAVGTANAAGAAEAVETAGTVGKAGAGAVNAAMAAAQPLVVYLPVFLLRAYTLASKSAKWGYTACFNAQEEVMPRIGATMFYRQQ